VNKAFKAVLAAIHATYNDVYIVLAPPRCSSTAFARVFWEHPSINFYSHEPFDAAYYQKHDVVSVLQTIEHATNIRPYKKSLSTHERKLIVKEMTFQVGENFPILFSITQHPIVLLIRNPLLSIKSRMQKLQEAGQNPLFPFVESGWHDLQAQLLQCQVANVPYLVIDTADFRNAPERVCKKVFNMLGLSFSAHMVSWNPVKDISLGNLGGVQKHWYQRVLSSTGIQPDVESIPNIMEFPNAGGFRDHGRDCLHIYETICTDAQRIRP